TGPLFVQVTATSAGQKNNSVEVFSNEGPGNTGTAHLTVNGGPPPTPPTISKSFAPASISVGATSSLSFTITNPNASTTFDGVAFTDTLPAGVTVPDSSVSHCGVPPAPSP